LRFEVLQNLKTQVAPGSTPSSCKEHGALQVRDNLFIFAPKEAPCNLEQSYMCTFLIFSPSEEKKNKYGKKGV